LQKYSISVFFLGLIGMIYMIDNLYPYGRFTPFQIMVPTTTTFAANFLNLMGFQTSTSTHTSAYYGSLSRLQVYDTRGKLLARFDIAWPCSGVESLLIYTVTILLFLKKMDISWKHKTLYFMIGAVVTYFINVLRIATIFMIAINQGDWLSFHNFYGQLYSITWIISYPLMVIGSQALWGKIRNWRTEHKQPFTVN
jgi:exosortase/archaeosortase family protein